MRIVILDHINISKEARAKLNKLGATIYDDLPSEDEIIERVKDAEIITANYIDITKRVIDSATNLKYIVVPAVGFEWVDHSYAAKKDVRVLNCPTHNSLAVAEHAVGLMFAVQRRLLESSNRLKTGGWNPSDFMGNELRGSKLGVVGFGKIGQKVSAMGEALGMTVGNVNSKSTEKEWESIFKLSDIICACLPQNDNTLHIINKDKLDLVKASAIIINVGRGSTIDSGVLVAALNEGRLAGAGLDVYEDEPLTGKPDESIVKIANMANVVATPHIANNTVQSAQRLSGELLNDVDSCLKDEPINVVN